MEIGTIPIKEDKPLAIPLNLYSIEYTSYNQFHKDCLHLENSKMIVPTIFEKNGCVTTYFHYAAEFIPLKPKQKHLDTDGFLVTFLMYNEPGVYFSHYPDINLAWEDAKKNIHPNIEKVILNRYRLVKEWRDIFIQPFEVCLSNLNPNLYNKNYL
jgi:hypothetical protein